MRQCIEPSSNVNAKIVLQRWSCFVFLVRILPSMLCYSKSQDFSSSPNLSCKLWILNWNILPLKNILWNFTYFHLSVWIGLKSKMAQIFCTLPHFRLPQHQFSKSDLIGESASVFEVAFHYSVFIHKWPRPWLILDLASSLYSSITAIQQSKVMVFNFPTPTYTPTPTPMWSLAPPHHSVFVVQLEGA